MRKGSAEEELLEYWDEGELLDGYISAQWHELKLIEYGKLNYRYSTREERPFVSNSSNIKSSELKLILTYLNTLRDYWYKNFHKIFFRPKLKSKIDFNKLKGYEGKPIVFKKHKKR